MPALQAVEGVRYAGIGVATAQERAIAGDATGPDAESVSRVAAQGAAALEFQKEFGGTVWESFDGLLESSEVDAVYIPLPPALHFPWAKRALESGKHVLLEKPFATSLAQAEELVILSRERGLAVHENYMFAFHSPMDHLRNQIAAGVVGDVRMVRVDFGFPFRGSNDFRYSKKLGGGALLDCGGYTLKLASMLLGPTARVSDASLGYGRGLEVDLSGSATLRNEEGQVAQVSFGMDNDYRCDVDAWGSTGTLRSGRILTAPAGFAPTFELRRNGEVETVALEPDDSFAKSIRHFADCVRDPQAAERQREEILRQAHLLDQFQSLA